MSANMLVGGPFIASAMLSLAVVAPAHSHTGAVFTSSNSPAGNQVLAFRRGVFGQLSPAGAFDSEGTGTGGGLGNQGALVLSGNGRWMLVVNAGSDSVSVFRVQGTHLTLTDVEPSGGMRPVSVAIHGNLVYALNAMGAGNVSGFTLTNSGDLQPLAGSTRPLSGAAMTGAAQAQFSPDGDVLVVTEKATNLITTYTVDDSGLLSDPDAQASSGMTPFGFDFTSNGRLIVSEAFGGMPDASALSSYRVDGQGELDVISASIPTTETAACWVEITRNNRFAYTTNTASGTVSGYRIAAQSGQLTRLDADGVTAATGEGTSPIDLDLSDNSLFLYVLNSGTQQIEGFFVNPFNGSLSQVETIGGLPVGANGLIAR